MDNLLALFDQSVGLFDAQVKSVGAHDWNKPTPDTEWNVRQLVEHLIDEHRWMPPLLGGHDLATAEQIVAGTAATDDPAADWHSAMVSTQQAIADPDVLTRTVSLSRGPTPASQYLVEMTFDAAIHAWDLGKAIGNDVELPGDVVAALYPMVIGMKDIMVESGMFAPPVDIGPDASQRDQLLAATGRDPR